jgi:DNA-binding HxlR family transcriptional regulator
MATTRTYRDRCGVARALDVVGERWSLLIVRELLLGPKRYTDIRAGVPRATPNVLSERLRELEQGGVLRRRTLGPPVSARVYELTERGYALEPVLLALGRWGSASPAAADAEMSVDSHALALRTLFDAAAAGERSLSVNLEIEGDVLAAHVAAGELRITRGGDPGAQATLAVDRATLRALLWEGRRVSELPPGAASGDLASAQDFLGLFPRPGAGSPQRP